MGMTIEELITFCEEEEYNHRLKCKRYDDASGYTRSKDKNIRTACAIREDSYADFYKEISDTMRKYQKIQADYNARLKADLVAILTEIQLEIEEQVLESLSDGGDDWFTAEKVNECLDIIDKHKAESEVKE